MITLNDTPTTDNAVKWVVKILGDNNIYYITDTDGGLVLTNTYIGDGLLKTSDFETLSQITDAVDISVGGNIDQASSFTFGLIRWSSNANLNGFMNEFYPATSGEYLVGREVNVGLIWAGTTDAEITWLKRFYIEDYDYAPAYISIYCVEKSELDLFELPYYEIQEDIDNGISYFPYALPDNFGTIIPITYGAFTTDSGDSVSNSWLAESFGLAPALLVDSAYSQFIIASHKCKTTDTALFKYLSGVNTYMKLTNSSSAVTNNVHCYITFKDSAQTTYGKIKILLKELSPYSNVVLQVSKTTNIDKTDYVTITSGDRIALRTGASLSTADVGVLGSIAVNFLCNPNANAVDVTVNFYNSGLTTPIESTGSVQPSQIGTDSFYYYAFDTVTVAKKDTTLPWTIEEIMGLEYFVNIAAPETMNVYYGYLDLQNIIVSGVVADTPAYTPRRKFMGFI